MNTVLTALIRHPKALHAKNAAYQQVQQALNSRLYQQTGHYVTVKEVSVGVMLLLALVFVGILAAILKSS